MGKNKMTASQIDGVNYKRAKTWQIALAMMTGAGQMVFYRDYEEKSVNKIFYDNDRRKTGMKSARL